MKPPDYKPVSVRCVQDGDWLWFPATKTTTGEGFWMFDPVDPAAHTAKEAIQKIMGRLH